jgi:hypothetical protein
MATTAPMATGHITINIGNAGDESSEGWGGAGAHVELTLGLAPGTKLPPVARLGALVDQPPPGRAAAGSPQTKGLPHFRQHCQGSQSGCPVPELVVNISVTSAWVSAMSNVARELLQGRGPNDLEVPPIACDPDDPGDN